MGLSNAIPTEYLTQGEQYRSLQSWVPGGRDVIEGFGRNYLISTNTDCAWRGWRFDRGVTA